MKGTSFFVLLLAGVLFEPCVESFSHSQSPARRTSTQLYVVSRFRRLFRGKSGEESSKSASKRSITSIPVRSRPLVKLDAETGTYRPYENQASPQSVVSSPKRGPSPWTKLKGAFYNALDGVSDLPKRFLKPGKASPVVQSYSDSVESSSRRKSETPAEKWMRAYATANLTATSLDSTSNPKESLYTQVKGGIYGGLDGIKYLFSKEKAPETPLVDRAGYKPVSRPSVNVEFGDFQYDITSKNPIRHWKARMAIRKLEAQRRAREFQEQREAIVDGVKGTVYTAVDVVTATAQAVQSLPDTTSQVAQNAEQTYMQTASTLASMPRKIDSALNTVQKFPEKVKQTADEVNANVENGIQLVSKAVQDIQSIPTTVTNKFKETRDSIESAKNNVENAFVKVKVMTGLQDPPPKPPPPPPPPPTPTKIGLKVGGTVVSIASKGAWFVSKGLVNFGFTGAKAAYAAATKTRQKNASSDKRSQESKLKGRQVSDGTVALNRTPKGSSKSPPLSIPIPTEEIPFFAQASSAEAAKKGTGMDGEVNQQVTDALKLAEEALAFSESPNDMQSVAALRKAKDAADQATQDANDVKRLVGKNK